MNRLSPLLRRLVPLLLVSLGCNGAVLDGGRGGTGNGGSTPAQWCQSWPGRSEPEWGQRQRSSASGSRPIGARAGQRVHGGRPWHPKSRLWRLTSSQFKHTVADTFGFTVPSLDSLPSESRLDGFANASDRLGLSSALFDFYGRAADDIAAEAVRKSADLLGCPVTALGHRHLPERLPEQGRPARLAASADRRRGHQADQAVHRRGRRSSGPKAGSRP